MGWEAEPYKFFDVVNSTGTSRPNSMSAWDIEDWQLVERRTGGITERNIVDTFDTKADAFDEGKDRVMFEVGKALVRALSIDESSITRQYWAVGHRRVEVRTLSERKMEKVERREASGSWDSPFTEANRPYWGIFQRNEDKGAYELKKRWPTKSRMVEMAKTGFRNRKIRKLVIKKANGEVQSEQIHPLAKYPTR